MIHKERTLMLLKPNIIKERNVGKALADVEAEGFHIISLKTVMLTHHLLEKFYAEHAHKPFFKALVDYMTSGEVVAVILEAPHACSKLRDLLGATDPLKAAKHTLRSKYGHNIDANGFHGSDNPEKYEYEKKLIFDLHSHVFAHHSVDETL